MTVERALAEPVTSPTFRKIIKYHPVEGDAVTHGDSHSISSLILDHAGQNQQQEVSHYETAAQSQAVNLKTNHRRLFDSVVPSQAASLNNDRWNLINSVAQPQAVSMKVDRRNLFDGLAPSQTVNTKSDYRNLKTQSHKTVPTAPVTLTPVWNLLESLSEDQVMEALQAFGAHEEFDINMSDYDEVHPKRRSQD